MVGQEHEHQKDAKKNRCGGNKPQRLCFEPQVHEVERNDRSLREGHGNQHYCDTKFSDRKKHSANLTAAGTLYRMLALAKSGLEETAK